jgi:hypothetical protein
MLQGAGGTQTFRWFLSFLFSPGYTTTRRTSRGNIDIYIFTGRGAWPTSNFRRDGIYLVYSFITALNKRNLKRPGRGHMGHDATPFILLREKRGTFIILLEKRATSILLPEKRALECATYILLLKKSGAG